MFAKDASTAICRALAAAAALLATAAPAEPGPPVSARELVEAITVEADGQLPRFYEPVCPVAEGLPRDFSAAVEERVRAVAAAAGISVAPPRDCRANVVILVADDPEAALELLRRRRPDIFAGLTSSEVRRVLTAAGPVRTWQISEVRRTEGAPIAGTSKVSLDEDVHLNHGVPTSLLREHTRRHLRLSVALFDLASVDGMTLMQIADHAAMRGLAPARPASVVAGRSILGLFEAEDRSARLPAITRWDFAYLRALYRSDGALRGGAQRAVIGRLVEKNLRETPR